MSAFGPRLYFVPTYPANTVVVRHPVQQNPHAVSVPAQAALATVASQIEQKPQEIEATITPAAPIARRVSLAAALLEENTSRQEQRLHVKRANPLRFALDEDLRLYAEPLAAALRMTNSDAKKAALIAICRQRDDYLHTALSAFARPASPINKALIAGIIAAFDIKTRRELLAIVAPSLTQYWATGADGLPHIIEDTSESLELGPLALEKEGSAGYTDARNLHTLSIEQHMSSRQVWSLDFREAIYNRTSLPLAFSRALSGTSIATLKTRLQALEEPLHNAKTHRDEDLLVAAAAVAAFFDELGSELPAVLDEKFLLGLEPNSPIRRFLQYKDLLGEEFSRVCNDELWNIWSRALSSTAEDILSLKPEPKEAPLLSEADLSGCQVVETLPLRFVKTYLLDTNREAHARLAPMSAEKQEELFSDEALCDHLCAQLLHPPFVPALFSAFWSRNNPERALQIYRRAGIHAPFCEGMMLAHPERLLAWDAGALVSAASGHLNRATDAARVSTSLAFLQRLAGLSDRHSEQVVGTLVGSPELAVAINQGYLEDLIATVALCKPLDAGSWFALLSATDAAHSTTILAFILKRASPDECQKLYPCIPQLPRLRLLQLLDTSLLVAACMGPNLASFLSWLREQGLSEQDIDDRLFVNQSSLMAALRHAPDATRSSLFARLGNYDSESAFAILSTSSEPLLACCGPESLLEYWNCLKGLALSPEKMTKLLGAAPSDGEGLAWIHKPASFPNFINRMQLRAILKEAALLGYLEKSVVAKAFEKMQVEKDHDLPEYALDLHSLQYSKEQILEILAAVNTAPWELTEFDDALATIGLTPKELVLALPASSLFYALSDLGEGKEQRRFKDLCLWLLPLELTEAQLLPLMTCEGSSLVCTAIPSCRAVLELFVTSSWSLEGRRALLKPDAAVSMKYFGSDLEAHVTTYCSQMSALDYAPDEVLAELSNSTFSALLNFPTKDQSFMKKLAELGASPAALRSLFTGHLLVKAYRILEALICLVSDPALRLEIFNDIAHDTFLHNLTRQHGLELAKECGLSRERYVEWLRKHFFMLDFSCDTLAYALNMRFKDHASLTKSEVYSVLSVRTASGRSALAEVLPIRNAKLLLFAVHGHGFTRNETEQMLGEELSKRHKSDLDDLYYLPTHAATVIHSATPPYHGPIHTQTIWW